MLHLKQFSLCCNRFISKYIFKMDKAYLRHIEDKFEISFKYENPALKVNRSFNLCRQSSEQISAFTSRIITNLEKEIKKKNKSNPDLPTISVSVIVNNEPIVDDQTICQDVFTSENSIVLKIIDKEYSVIVNSPFITSIHLPKSILANCLVYPTKMESINTIKEKSQFEWHKSIDKNKWTPVANSYTFTPSKNEIDSYLKFVCIPKNDTLEGPTVEAVSSVKVQASPVDVFPFEKRQSNTTAKCTHPTFRVVTYNILADLYADMEYTQTVLHPYCAKHAFDLDYRKQLFMKELIGYNADIMCLQEVDRKVFKHDLEPIFKHFGYSCNYCVKKEPVAEGLACFFNLNRFSQLESIRFVLADEIESNCLFSELFNKVKSKESLLERFMTRSTVLQVNILQSLQADEILIVANTHLYFHPDSDHIRLLQGGMIIKYLEHLKQSTEVKQSGKRVSLLFCGDFNSSPDSGIYQLYTSGKIPEDCIDFQSNESEAVEGVSFEHSIPLDSACGTPEFTNFTDNFKECLDYIYYQTDNLDKVSMAPFPSVDEMSAHIALPSIVFPSDHVSLCADLKFQN